MVIDTSALIAILLGEPERPAFRDAILAAPSRVMPAPNYLEAAIVTVNRLGEASLAELRSVIDGLEIDLVDFTQEHAAVAEDAFLRYGKGRHPAALNFGDCIAYAVAKAESQPLLFKGADFSLTDVAAAA